jgi:hypothetical protein
MNSPSGRFAGCTPGKTPAQTIVQTPALRADRLAPLIPRETPLGAGSIGIAPPSSASSTDSRERSGVAAASLSWLDRVALQGALMILAKLACALARARARAAP